MRKKLFVFFIISLILIVLFLWWRLGQIDTSTVVYIRKGKLEAWANRCEKFIREKNKLPESLYEVAWYNEQGPPRCRVEIGAELPVGEIGALKDKELFGKNVEYGFLASKKGWFIMELKPGKLWKHQLMIDDSRQFFEVRKIHSD